MPSANDIQVAGTHYKATIQHWDYVILALHNRYLEGNITKYVVRHRKKNGLQDLDKAMHYTQKLIESYSAGRVGFLNRAPDFDTHKFIADNGLNSYEAFIVNRLAGWDRLQHLEQVAFNIEILRRNARDEELRIQAIKAGADVPLTHEPTSGYTNQDR